MKLCKDCKHFRRFIFGVHLSKCASPEVGIDPLTGKRRDSFADNNRMFHWKCGEDGKWFKPK